MNVKYLGEMKGVKLEAVSNEEQIAGGDKEEKTGKHIFACMDLECSHIGYISDFEAVGE